MWSEQWDDKIREAAGQAEPASGMEQGWQGMEPLLDKHLPQDRKKRRFFLLLFLLATSAGSVFLALEPGKMSQKATPASELSQVLPSQRRSTDQPAGADQPLQQQLPLDSSSHIAPGVAATDILITKTADRTQNKPMDLAQKQTTNRIPKATTNSTQKQTTAGDLKLPLNPTHRATSASTETLPPALHTSTENSVLPYTPNTQKQEESNSLLPASTPVLSNESLTDSMHTSIDSSANADDEAPSAPKRTREKNPRWAISAVVGADISGTQPGKPGQWRPAVGVLINYQLNRRLQLRTGFLTTRKVYQAGEGDYHPPKIFWNYVSKLEHVDANCLIYEIPLLLQYRLGKQASSRWAVSAGFSSLLMKKESYDYDFIDLAGQDRYMNREYENYSNHFFSTLHLSGSYRLPLSRRWNFGVEPYVKLPLSGVGYGKVRLYSAGIMLSATIHP